MKLKLYILDGLRLLFVQAAQILLMSITTLVGILLLNIASLVGSWIASCL